MRICIDATSPLIALAMTFCFASNAGATVNLLTNGDFEASSSETATPPGWTNIGHTDGVIAYSLVGAPSYNGKYFYDLGGFGDPSGPIGDGLRQTVATIPGQAYLLSFGLSSENRSGYSDLTVSVGDFSIIYGQPTTSAGGFQKSFVSQTVNFLATKSETTLSFIESFNSSGGDNDPIIDNVMLLGPAVTTGAVPEPSIWAMMLIGFGGLGFLGFGKARRDAAQQLS